MWSALPDRGCADIAACTAACDAGDGMACARAGWMWAHPTGSDAGDVARAYILYDKGCRLRECRACWEGGSMRARYSGLHNFEEVFTRDEAACRGGDPNACRKIAPLYHPRRQYADYEQRACDLGSAEACAKLADVYGKRELLVRGADGHWQTLEPPSDAWTTLVGRACTLGRVASCVTVGAGRGRVAVPGLAPARSVEAQWKRAADLLDPLCRRGEASACRVLGELRGELAASPAKPGWDATVERRYLDDACAMGDADGCLLLGVSLLRAQGFKGDTQEAAAALDAGCAHGSGRACIALSQITADRRRAQDLVNAGCERGMRGHRGNIYSNAGLPELPQPLNCRPARSEASGPRR
jgi:TPR repeat protein